MEREREEKERNMSHAAKIKMHQLCSNFKLLQIQNPHEEVYKEEGTINRSFNIVMK